MSTTPVLGLIGGTGLTELQEAAETLEITTPYGEPSGPIQVIQVNRYGCCFCHGTAVRIAFRRTASITGPICGLCARRAPGRYWRFRRLAASRKICARNAGRI